MFIHMAERQRELKTHPCMRQCMKSMNGRCIIPDFSYSFNLNGVGSMAAGQHGTARSLQRRVELINSSMYTSIIIVCCPSRSFHLSLCTTCPLTKILTSSTCAMNVCTLDGFVSVGAQSSLRSPNNPSYSLAERDLYSFKCLQWFHRDQERNHSPCLTDEKTVSFHLLCKLAK